MSVAEHSFRSCERGRCFTCGRSIATVNAMSATGSPSTPKDLRPIELDELDQRIVEILEREGRITNADLAAALDIAPSTAHTRTRSLVERGVITGFHASVDHRRLGRGLQAIIGVTLRGGTRHDAIVRFAEEVRVLPQVVQLFFLGGTDDFMVHIAVADSSEVRQFVVDNLSTQPFVASTRTSLIFEYHRNAVASSFS